MLVMVCRPSDALNESGVTRAFARFAPSGADSSSDSVTLSLVV